jgi:hypothetical protein
MQQLSGISVRPHPNLLWFVVNLCANIPIIFRLYNGAGNRGARRVRARMIVVAHAVVQ